MFNFEKFACSLSRCISQWIFKKIYIYTCIFHVSLKSEKIDQRKPYSIVMYIKYSLKSLSRARDFFSNFFQHSRLVLVRSRTKDFQGFCCECAECHTTTLNLHVFAPRTQQIHRISPLWLFVLLMESLASQIKCEFLENKRNETLCTLREKH